MDEVSKDAASMALEILQELAGQRVQVQVDNDHHALERFINQRDLSDGSDYFSENTKAAYLRDIRRFNLFLQDRYKGVSYGHIVFDHVEAFVGWLINPPTELIASDGKKRDLAGNLIPRERRWPHGHPEWKPFYGSGVTSKSTIKSTLASLKAFFAWMRRIGYIQYNPFAVQKVRKPEKQSGFEEHYLEDEDISAIIRYLTGKQRAFQQGRTAILDNPRYTRFVRQRFCWMSYMMTGLRTSELLQATTADLSWRTRNNESMLYLNVLGKGRRSKEQLQISTLFWEELVTYRGALGKDPHPIDAEPLVFNLKGTKAVTSRETIHTVIVDLLREVADAQAERGHYASELRLRAASTHWLRHSFVSRLVEITGNLGMAQKLARHSSQNTTAGYTHSEAKAVRSALDQLAEELSAARAL